MENYSELEYPGYVFNPRTNQITRLEETMLIEGCCTDKKPDTIRPFDFVAKNCSTCKYGESIPQPSNANPQAERGPEVICRFDNHPTQKWRSDYCMSRYTVSDAAFDEAEKKLRDYKATLPCGKWGAE